MIADVSIDEANAGFIQRGLCGLLTNLEIKTWQLLTSEERYNRLIESREHHPINTAGFWAIRQAAIDIHPDKIF